MKGLVFHIPAIVLAIVAALWFSHARRGSISLQAAIATQRAELASLPPPDPRAADAAKAEADTIARRNEELRAELRRIEEATSNARKETALLQAKIPRATDGEHTESFGRVADMGREIGQLLRLSSDDKPAANEGDKSRDLPGLMMKLVTWAPELSGFEETPAEIAAFQSAVLREMLALGDSQARQAEALIKAHYTAMKSAGLTYASRDTSGWRERRSASLTQLLWHLRPFIPANTKQAALLSSIVNAGGGLETRTETKLSPEPGESQINVRMLLPTWPHVPWLPEKK